MMKKKAKKKMGRPYDFHEAKSVTLRVRVTATEAARLKGEARRTGKTISDLLMKRYREK